ncbi:MAG: hypothetical protein Q9201_005260 [Fulgogasparrea decipioides]
MPPAVDTPSKPARPHRHKQRNTEMSQQYPSGLAEEADSRQTKSDLDLPKKDSGAPSSLQPSMSQPASEHAGRAKVNRPTSDIPTSKQTKQTPKKKQRGNLNGLSPTPKHKSTPRPDLRTNSMTPVKKPVTPMQYYAGPTFHASPAASSLPMPKFFSKSVPEVNKVPSMQTMMNETGETSSDQSEDSPTLAIVKRVGEQPSREESPLDIFFKADREQKERQRKEQEVDSVGQDPAILAPNFDPPRHHSRHSTNGSMGALFPMELENKESIKTSHEKTFSEAFTGNPNANVSESSSTVEATETPEQTEQRKAKTMALKKLLMSSIPATTDSISRPRVNLKDNAANPDAPSVQKRAASSPFQNQVAAQSARQGSPCPRPSSNLRKELSASVIPDDGPLPELPATPTPSQTRNAQKSATQGDQQGFPPDGRTRTSFAHSTPLRSSPVSKPVLSSSPYKQMEDDLRRILKMDSLPSDGATSVSS